MYLRQLHQPAAQPGRRGVMTIFCVVCLVALLSVVALALDGGRLQEERRRVQAVADAAALSAACDLYDWYWVNSGADPSDTAKASARATAAANGYAHDGVRTIVTVNIPPSTGFYTVRRGYAEVIVEHSVDRGFSGIFGSGPIPVRARAVALGLPIAADVGILVLEPTNRSAFNAQGSGTTTVSGTPVVVNSVNDAGAVAGGGGTVSALKFVFAGGYVTSGGGATFNGPIYTNRPPMEDPLADMPPPDPSTMIVQSTRKIQYTSGEMTLEPGVYRGGINVSGTGSLTLKPGIYYMDGGGFQFSGQGSLTGLEVMIYNDPRPSQADGISVTGQGSITLTAPTTGIYQGVTFFQNRSSNTTGTVAGTGGGTSITGTFYFPGALLDISGNGGVNNLGSQYISRELNLGGNGDINISWSPDKVARKRSIILVE